ncbi:hypothetical protein H7J71_25205 [Mycolicibacterium peregrinum]|uniref:hypothetical protein n=1 Tax=Mycolicibacterium peregrinum TaxID=43304 RepID=UPI0006D7B462|nr:hypothetical protein [Mycolicibacterium peregrinum]MCV7205307.1 hypothetical protein [Mycolicibacterium peregrinum]ORW54797.1 hypothetical protein AWC21_23935 [Mycolicibacterium peregrinum]
MSSKKLVLIEYTERVESSAGRADEDSKKATIEAGTRRYVDAASAKHLVDKRKVAKVVVDDDDKAETKSAAAKAGPKPADASGN